MTTDPSLQAQDDAAAEVAVGPRVALEDLKLAIEREDYINAGYAVATMSSDDQTLSPIPVNHPLDLLTICVLTLRNGFTVTGESACAYPANYDAALGRQIAYRHAIEKVWMLEGYLLKERLYEAKLDREEAQALSEKTARELALERADGPKLDAHGLPIEDDA